MNKRWKTVPLCERCFIDEEDPISFDGDKPSLVRHPFQIDGSVRKVEECFNCEHRTIVGIYVKREVFEDDPTEEVLEGGVVLEPRAYLEGPI